MRVTLNGIVSADDDQQVYDWWGLSAFSPRAIRKAIAENPEGEELVLEINSPGGSVYAGDEIYTILRSASNVRTRAEIQSIAASAASYLCLGCSEIWISPVAQMMIHLPETTTWGDRVAHQRSIGLLDSVREAILNAYELRSGGKADRAEFGRMMSAETWLTAQEAVDLGLADGILFQEESVPLDIVNCAGSGLRALGRGGVPDIAVLRAEYRRAMDKLVDNPVKPSGDPLKSGDMPWQAKARLDLEKMRF